MLVAFLLWRNKILEVLYSKKNFFLETWKARDPQEIGQYEAERFQLKNRIEMLEMEKKERDKIISDMPTNGPELLVDNSAKNQTRYAFVMSLIFLPSLADHFG